MGKTLQLEQIKEFIVYLAPTSQLPEHAPDLLSAPRIVVDHPRVAVSRILEEKLADVLVSVLFALHSQLCEAHDIGQLHHEVLVVVVDARGPSSHALARSDKPCGQSHMLSIANIRTKKAICSRSQV